MKNCAHFQAFQQLLLLKEESGHNYILQMSWSKAVLYLVSCDQNKALNIYQCIQKDFSSSRLLQLSALAGCTGLRELAAEHYMSFFRRGTYLCAIKLSFPLKPPTISTYKSSSVQKRKQKTNSNV